MNSSDFLLYIDPGTGSMLFSILIGAAATLFFLFKALIIKIKILISGKKGAIQTDSSYNDYAIDFTNIKDIITNASKNPELQQKRLEAKKQAWMFQGRAQENVADFMIETLSQKSN